MINDAAGTISGMRAAPANDQRQPEAGTLYVIATPIGNLADLGGRARELLERLPMIAAEDTRVSRRLMADRSEPVRMISVNEHSEKAALAGVIDALLGGLDVGLVSDAGTPLVSDPGFRLVAEAHDAGIRVCPVPGPCAAIAALSAAGLPSDRFCFEGFLPARSAARRSRLTALSEQSASLIFYVPARDLAPVLDDLAAVFGPDRPASVGRELTKLHETIKRASVAELRDWVAADPNQQRGEAVLVVAGNPDASPPIPVRALAEELARELAPARAAKVLARLSGLSRQQAWDLIQALND